MYNTNDGSLLDLIKDLSPGAVDMLYMAFSGKIYMRGIQTAQALTQNSESSTAQRVSSPWAFLRNASSSPTKGGKK